MKKTLLLCLVVILPTLLVARQEGTMFGIRAAQVARMNGRDCRLAGITSYNFNGGGWEPGDMEDVFYDPAYPARRDSSSCSCWNFDEEQWCHNATEKYFWNAAGRIETVLWVAYGIALTGESHLEYDGQGRIIHSYDRSYDYYGNSTGTYRSHYIWSPSDLTTYAYNLSYGDCYYHKTEGEFDAQGRLVSMDSFFSPDSLSWQPNWRTVMSYHAGDASNFSDFEELISSYSYYDLGYNESCCFGFGTIKLDQMEGYFWNNREWLCVIRNNYTWNDAGTRLLRTETEDCYLGYWQPDTRHDLLYDDDGNVARILISYWDESSWSPEKKFEFEWEYGSSADDPVSPAPPSLSLSLWPQPFRDELCIQPCSEKAGIHRIGIYDLRGRLLRTLSADNAQTVVWDGRDSSGTNCASGIYLIRTEQAGRQATARTVKIK